MRFNPDRLLNSIQVSGGCWEWTKLRNKMGYGIFAIRVFAHRLVWQLLNGEIPKDRVICHRCDNPSCVRPDHLFMGTQGDNVRDAMMKGRLVKRNHAKAGNPNAKLTYDQVLEIRRLYMTTAMSQAGIARRFQLSEGTVNHIVSGKSWGLDPVVKKKRLGYYSNLDEQKIRKIRKLYHGGMSQASIGEKFKVGQPAIVKILLRKSWKWVPPCDLCKGPCRMDLSERLKNRRVAKGGRHHWARLTTRDVQIIKRQAQRGISGKKLAERFGVSSGAIYLILNGRNWKHVKV